MPPRIKIEDKHTYSTANNFIVGNNRATNISAPVNNFVWFTPYYPVLGADENQRIGRKIQSQSIGFEGYLSLNTRPARENDYPNLLDYFNGYMQQFMTDTPAENYEFNMDWQKLLIPIRHMVVEFNDEDFYKGTQAEKGLYLSAWYRNLVTQSMGGNSNLPSVQQSTLRESTPYTGRFKILKDTMYWLDFNDKHCIHFNYQLPYKRTITFDADGSDPTNSHIYFLFIGPIQPTIDFGNVGFGEWLNNSGSDTSVPCQVATVNTNLKLKYIDF